MSQEKYVCEICGMFECDSEADLFFHEQDCEADLEIYDVESGHFLLKCSNEPEKKESGTSWDTHYIDWLLPLKPSSGVYIDNIIHSRMVDGKVGRALEWLDFANLAQLLAYLKHTYGADSPIYSQAYAYFSESDKK